MIVLAPCCWWPAPVASSFRNHPDAKPGPEPAPGAMRRHRHHAAKPGALKDSIIVADFINKTGDAVFDATLDQALRVQLASLQYSTSSASSTFVRAFSTLAGSRTRPSPRRSPARSGSGKG